MEVITNEFYYKRNNYKKLQKINLKKLKIFFKIIKTIK